MSIFVLQNFLGSFLIGINKHLIGKDLHKLQNRMGFSNLIFAK